METGFGQNMVYKQEKQKKSSFQGQKKLKQRAQLDFCSMMETNIIPVGKVFHAEAEEGVLDKIKPLFHDSGENFRKLCEKIILKRVE